MCDWHVYNKPLLTYLLTYLLRTAAIWNSWRWMGYSKTINGGVNCMFVLPPFLCLPTAVMRNHFFGNNSGKPEPIGTKFTRRRQLAWHPPLQTARSLRQTDAQNRAEKTHFRNFLSSNNARIILPTSRQPISLKFELKTWIDVIMNSLGKQLRNFPNKGSLTPKSHFMFFSVHFRYARSSVGL